VLGTSRSIFHTLLKVFLESDYDSSGVVPFAIFVLALKDMGAMLSHSELIVLARPHAVERDKERHKAREKARERDRVRERETHNANSANSFRESQLRGSLNSRKGSHHASFGEFLADHALLDDHDDRDELDGLVVEIEDDTLVHYAPFVRELSDCIETMIEQRGGLPLTPVLPWVLTEFALVDLLLSQLEAMLPAERRKTLIALQYACENADTKRVRSDFVSSYWMCLTACDLIGWLLVYTDWRVGWLCFAISAVELRISITTH
jgi:hypothetical protein